MAMGMVTPTVKVPQGLLYSALTTAMARPAMATIRIRMMAMEVMKPEKRAQFPLCYFSQ